MYTAHEVIIVVITGSGPQILENYGSNAFAKQCVARIGNSQPPTRMI
jgi:hypothetical protein